MAKADCVKNARVVVEKPFGHDLASAQELNGILHQFFPEESIFRIDHYLGKEPVQNLTYFRFANPLIEAGWDKPNTLKAFKSPWPRALEWWGRGKFYEEAGAVRDVVQNHMLEVIACLAMECPAGISDHEARPRRTRAVARGSAGGRSSRRTLCAANSRAIGAETRRGCRFASGNVRCDAVLYRQ